LTISQIKTAKTEYAIDKIRRQMADWEKIFGT
jgi:hypothetical protein